MLCCGGFRDVDWLLQSSTQVHRSLLDDLSNVFDPVLLVVDTWSLWYNSWLGEIKVRFIGLYIYNNIVKEIIYEAPFKTLLQNTLC